MPNFQETLQYCLDSIRDKEGSDGHINNILAIAQILAAADPGIPNAKAGPSMVMYDSAGNKYVQTTMTWENDSE